MNNRSRRANASGELRTTLCLSTLLLLLGASCESRSTSSRDAGITDADLAADQALTCGSAVSKEDCLRCGPPEAGACRAPHTPCTEIPGNRDHCCVVGQGYFCACGINDQWQPTFCDPPAPRFDGATTN
jgi:hypothetical protein